MFTYYGNYRGLKDKLFRLKTVGEDFLETQLKRCLSTIDITLLGVGHMVGAGIYVLTGTVVRYTAGPGVVLSFIFAGIASLLSALCYAEFGSRVPKAGSAYTYSYVTVGEFWAFVIGWNIILEHMLGAAAVARSWSGYLDSLLGHVIRNGTVSALGEMGGGFLSSYPDFIAFLVVVLVACFMGYGAKTSLNVNTIFTVINMAVIFFVIVVGFCLADFSYWTRQGQVEQGGFLEYAVDGDGGFMPWGMRGVLAGAASCFFAYIGFDGIATAGEEASDPAKSIPIATFIAMSIVTACYVFMSAALTLMVPYTHVHPTSAFSDAFEYRGLIWAKYVVAIGALSGMTTSLFGSLFALPRCVYAMANDGLIFRSLAFIHPRTQVPTFAVAIFGAMTAVIALLFDIETLVEFLSIGTLLAYTIVSGSVIILRYKPSRLLPETQAVKTDTVKEDVETTSKDQGMDDDTLLLSDDLAGKPKPFVMQKVPRLQTYLERFEQGSIVAWSVLVFVIVLLVNGTIIVYSMLHWYTILINIVLGLAALACFGVVCCHHQSNVQLKFKVPLVPLIPALSILINVTLMLNLAWVTWIRLVVWLGIGLLIYCFYGIKHSSENVDAVGKSTTYNTLICTPASTPGKEVVNLPGTATVSVEKQQPVEK